MREAPPFRTKADIVYETLRERILSGELRPSERVTISHVARDLGVSDIPAREGVKRLHADGLLDFVTHKGAVVASMDAADVEELFAIRSELEALALRRAAETIAPEQLAQLRTLLDEMAAAGRDGDMEAYGRLNRAFHMAAYAAQPYRRLLAMIESLWDSTDWCRRIFRADADSVRASSAEHEAIYAALAAGDGDAAARAVQIQKERSCRWLLQHIPDTQGDA
jgi:DNA-binding GntR family transcriptional regulator